MEPVQLHKIDEFEFAPITLRRKPSPTGELTDVEIFGHKVITEGVRVEMGGERKGKRPLVTISFPVEVLDIE